MQQNPITLAALIRAVVFGLIAAYLAYRRKKNPYLWFTIGFLLGVPGICAIFFLPFKKGKKRRRAAAARAQAKPLLSIPGPIDKFWYYLDPEHKQMGPMSHSALSKALHHGDISEATYVWNEEMADWKRVGELKA